MSAHTTSSDKLARAFCRHLQRAIGAVGVRKAAARNKLPSYEGCCASHDFCDANDVMAEAFKEVTLRDMDTESEGDLALWNEAWDLARSWGLIEPSAPTCAPPPTESSVPASQGEGGGS